MIKDDNAPPVILFAACIIDPLSASHAVIPRRADKQIAPKVVVTANVG